MQPFVPSQILEYLDSRFPQAKKQSERPGEEFYHVRQNAPGVQTLLTMIEGLPLHLLRLDPDSLGEYLEAVAAIRFALNAWNSGDAHFKLEKVPGRNRLHPFTLLRRNLVKLSDEWVIPGTSELEFISDSQFRGLLRMDISTVNQVLQNGEWKAATVLAGSVVEALLLWAIEDSNAKKVDALGDALKSLKAKGVLKDNPPKDLNEWNLHQFIEVALELDLISPDTATQCRLARGFRNLIHPGRAKRLQQPCNRATSLSAVAAVEHVINDLSKSPK